jgi:chromosome segregation ATPase
MDHVKEWLWLIGPALSFVVIPAVAWWLSRGFVTRAEFDGAKKRIDHAEERLDRGEQRFNELFASIREVKHAADEARDAAEKVMTVAGQITDMRVNIATLSGDIKLVTALLKRVEKDADRLIDGHLETGDA